MSTALTAEPGIKAHRIQIINYIVVLVTASITDSSIKKSVKYTKHSWLKYDDDSANCKLAKKLKPYGLK